MLKKLNDVFVFLLELMMMVSFGYYGYAQHSLWGQQWIFALLYPSIAGWLWGVFAAPRSTRRLGMPYLAIFRTLVLWLACIALYDCGYRSAALAAACITLLTQCVSLFLTDNPVESAGGIQKHGVVRSWK